MDIKFPWEKQGAGWRCIMPAEVTLFVSPEHLRMGRRGLQPSRGTKWHAGASIWNGKDTVSRYGRDVYLDKQEDAKAAQRLAETVYTEALNAKTHD